MTGRGGARLDLKDLRMATQSEAELQTGLPTGGISPLTLLHRGRPVYRRAGRRYRGDPCQRWATKQDPLSLASGLARAHRRPDIG
jgi:hypothetical protein